MDEEHTQETILIFYILSYVFGHVFIYSIFYVMYSSCD